MKSLHQQSKWQCNRHGGHKEPRETFCPERSCSCTVGEGADNDLVLKEWALYIFHQFNTKILRSSTVPKASVKRGKCWAVGKNFCACVLSFVHPNSPKFSSTFSGGNCLLCTLKSLPASCTPLSLPPFRLPSGTFPRLPHTDAMCHLLQRHKWPPCLQSFSFSALDSLCTAISVSAQPLTGVWDLRRD